MELTYAKTQDDLEQIADMMSKVFTRGSYFDFYQTRMDYQTKDPHYKPEHSRIVKVDGRVVSHVSIVEKYMRIGCGVVKVAGIGDVFTHPDHRGQSHSRILMEDAVKYMRENDYPLTMLYGIPNYYHKFGYIESMGLYTAFLKVKTIEKLDAPMKVRAAVPEDRDRLNELYNAAYAKKTGAMRREPAHWYKVFDLKKVLGTVALGEGGKIIGYALATPPRAPSQHISEAVTPDPATAASLLKHFAAQAGERLESEIELRVAPDHPLWQYAETLGGRFTTRLYSEGEGEGMLCTINLLRTLEDIREELEARLADSHFKGVSAALNFATDTAGAATIKWDGENLTVSGTADNSAPTLDIPQNLLTRSLVGYWHIDQLKLRAPEIVIPAEVEELLKALFPLQHPFTCEADYF